MDEIEFQEKVKDIIIYPGSLNELNEIERLKNSNREYELMALETPSYFIKGTLVEGLGDKIFPLLNFALKQYIGLSPELDKEERQFVEEISEEKTLKGIIEILNSSKETEIIKKIIIDLEIRVSAKELGADGIIHFQFLHRSGDDLEQYMGVPVKLKK